VAGALDRLDLDVLVAEDALGVFRYLVPEDDGVCFAEHEPDLVEEGFLLVHVLLDDGPAGVLVAHGAMSDGGDEGRHEASVVLDLPVDDGGDGAVRASGEEGRVG